MATTTSITTTYAGEKMQGFISAALLTATSLDAGGISVKPNVKYKSVIKTLSTDALVADATCDFTDTSTITLGERYLTPKELQVNVALCKADFRSDWDAISMGISAWDNLPPSFADYLVAYMAAKVAETTENTVWQGADGAGAFDGICTLAAADATVVDVVGVSAGAGGLTASNIVAELGKVVDAIPNTMYGKEDLYIYISQKAYRAYVRALGTLGFVDRFNNQNMGDVMFDGVKLFVANGMEDDTMVAAQSSNLWFGTGLLNDSNEVKVLDMADLDGSQNVRVIMRYTATVNYGIGSEIVLYTPVA